MRVPFFHEKHSILELPGMPRERDALLVALASARAEARRAVMTGWIALLAVLAGLLIIVVRFT